jgi:hypothetical protein
MRALIPIKMMVSRCEKCHWKYGECHWKYGNKHVAPGNWFCSYYQGKACDEIQTCTIKPFVAPVKLHIPEDQVRLDAFISEV